MKHSVAYDPRSAEVLENPFPTYQRLREETPVQFYDGLPVPYYIVFRHEDVRNASSNVEQFTARYGSTPRYAEPNVMLNDGDTHLAFRLVVQGRFTPKAMERYRAMVRQIAAGLLDEMIATGAPADVFEHLAMPMPVKSTLRLIGVDDENYREMGMLADHALLSGWMVLPPEQEAHIARRGPEIYEGWLQERETLLAKAGVTTPTKAHVGTVLPDDILSDILVGQVEGRPLTRSEQHHLLQLMVVGGGDTTAHLISNLIWRLLEDRSRWETVLADPERLIPVAVEESLRFDSPGLGLFRTTARALELHGETIPAHAKVQMSYPSANRDPSVFSDPDTFRLDRPMAEMRKHLTFGAGAHLCLGQHLARLEATTLLRELIERLPTLRLAGETARTENYGFWGRRKLPVGW